MPTASELVGRLRAPIDWSHALNEGDIWQIEEDRRQAASEIERLEAERDEARLVVASIDGGPESEAAAMISRIIRASFDAQHAKLAAEAQRDKLAGALLPLATEAEEWGEETGPERTWGDTVELWQSPGRRTKITVGDARRARAALAALEPKP